MARTERAGSRSQTLTLMSLSGFLELSLGNAREAWRWLEPALELQDELGRDISVGMPLCVIRPNAIETLVALDEVGKAEAAKGHARPGTGHRGALADREHDERVAGVGRRSGQPKREGRPRGRPSAA